ncbi:MAG: tetratricopeptide repeat protein [Chitinispirillales bacterium]|jgi:tetratricopeptide (TPR) repeat protein|nr:tetratricopeptide repeat protein [Chitinispirillales bacterium]
MKMSKSLSTYLVVALFYACAALLTPVFAAAQKPHIAVYVTGDKTENEKKALANEILNTLVKSGKYAPAVRINDFLAAIAVEQKKQRVSDAQFRDIAQQHGIEYICVTDITDLFNTSYLSLRIVNAATGESEVISSIYSDLKRFEDFTSVHDKVVGAMFTIANAKKPATPEPEQVPAIALDEEGGAPASGTDASYYYKQGHAFSQSNDHDGAIANYTEALKLDPRLVYALIARGSAYYSKGDYQSAVEDYSRSIELEPNDAGVFNNRGNAYRQMGNYDMARADYQAALRIDPNNAEARQSLELISLDKSGEEQSGQYTREKYGMHYGVTGGLHLDWLEFAGDHDYNGYPTIYNRYGGYDYWGYGVSGGIALSYQINDWLAYVAELNGTYRELWGGDKYFDGKFKELIVSVPVLARVNTTQWQNFGLYAESGIQIEIPYESKHRYDHDYYYGYGYDRSYHSTENRNNDLQIVIGGGLYAHLGITWYLGVRGTVSLVNFAGGEGRLFQSQAVLSMMY